MVIGPHVSCVFTLISWLFMNQIKGKRFKLNSSVIEWYQTIGYKEAEKFFFFFFFFFFFWGGGGGLFLTI